MHLEGILVVLCALACCICSALLMCAWRRVRLEIVFWISVAFACLAIANIALLFDVISAPDADYGGIRLAAGLTAVAALLYGVRRDAKNGRP
ncbi:MAG TPA: DUF5985 family protein [Hyphomonadaceae bacterium]|nr:DUF5985 family protein [Hyphomonadaceae bacterium]